MQLTIYIHGSNCISVAFEMFDYLSIVDPDELNNSSWYMYSIITKENQKQNYYFIFRMVLTGTTWASIIKLTHKIDSPNYNYLSAYKYVPNFRFANNIDRSYFVEIRVVPEIPEIHFKLLVFKKKNIINRLTMHGTFWFALHVIRSSLP